MKAIKLTISLRQIKVFTTFIVLLLVNGNLSFAETLFEKMQRILVVQANLTENDLSKLRKDELITKLLQPKDKREVAVLGVIRIETPLDKTLEAFQSTLSKQNRKSILKMGNFSNTPSVEDIETLTLEKNDIEDLKKCRIGSCNLKLSAPMIERFQKEVDWNASDYPEQTNRLFRQIILDYLKDYLTKGDEALIEYSDQPRVLRLKDEQISLLNNLIWVNEFAPEFTNYLKKIPRSELSNVRKSLNWTKISFGLKPVVIVTQTITYSTEKDGVMQILSVSKQIYASHYFDSSMSLTALIKFSEGAGNIKSYLLYSNHSRSSSLDGMFSDFKHSVVEREAIEKLTPLLQDTKKLVEANLNHQNKVQDLDDNWSFKDWLSERPFIIGISLLVIVLLGFGVIRRHLSANQQK